MLKHKGRLVAPVLVGLVFVLSVGACAPVVTGISPEQVQVMVATGVAGTVEAQNNMGTAVSLTVAAMAPVVSPTVSPTEIPLNLPSLTPLASVTPFATQSGGGVPGNKLRYACDSWTVKPRDGTAFKPGDPFDIKWIITNTGTANMRAGLDLEYLSGPKLTLNPGTQLPFLKPGDTFTFTADANAPMEKGNYVMTWKVEGGICFPYVAITSGRPGIDP